MNTLNWMKFLSLTLLLSLTGCGGGGGGEDPPPPVQDRVTVSGNVQLSNVIAGRSSRTAAIAFAGASVEMYDADRIDWVLPVAFARTDINGDYTLSSIGDEFDQVNPGSGHVAGDDIPPGNYTVIAYKFDASAAKLFVAVQPFVKRFEGDVTGNDLEAIDDQEFPQVSSMFGLVTRNNDGSFGGNTTLIARDAAIQITFSITMARGNLVGALSIKDSSDTVVPGSWGVSPDLRTATFYLQAGTLFTEGEVYSVEVTGGEGGATSIYGNILAQTVIGSFQATTADSTPPNIQLDTPSVSTNVPIKTKIIIRANELLDINNFEADITPSIGDKPTILYEGIGSNSGYPYLYQIIPNGDLELDTNYAINASGATDLAGNVLTAATFNFRTQAVEDLTAPVSTATPAGGAYGTAQNITLSSNEAGSTIFYSLDTGSGAATTETYSTPINISSDTTLSFWAEDISGNIEAQNTEIYTFVDTTAPTTTASPVGAIYTSDQSVTLSADETATIYYTTDNSTPTTSSSVYIGTIDIVGVEGDSVIVPLRFFAVDTANNSESPKTEVYTINLPDVTAPTSTASLPGGPYTSNQTVSLSANEPATIYFTTDGSTPTTTSATYSGPIAITGIEGSSIPRTLKFFAVDTAGNIETVQTILYTINIPDTTAPVSSASPAGGTYTVNQLVTLTADDPTATIYYTTDGSPPTTTSNVYSGAIAINGSQGSSVVTTLRFFAVDTATTPNAETPKSEVYTINIPDTTPPTTTASPAGGAYGGNVTVTLTCSDVHSSCATTWFTTDGSDPTSSVTRTTYTAPINMALVQDGPAKLLRYYSIDSAGVAETPKQESYNWDSSLNALNWDDATGTPTQTERWDDGTGTQGGVWQ